MAQSSCMTQIIFLISIPHFSFLLLSKMDLIPYLAEYFHYPDTKSRDYVHLRQSTTNKYGLIMEWFMIVFLSCIPIQNYLLGKGYLYLNRVHVLGPINLFFDRIIRRSETHNHPWLRITSQFFKHAAYVMYLNLNTIFQIVFWTTLFTVLALSDIHGGDLIFVTKRLGRLAVVSMPTIFFLTLRPSPLPNTLYLSLLPIHKWLSRVVVVLAILHTVIYCGNFQRNNSWHKAYKTANLYGWAALLGFVMIVITSLLKARDRSYKLFFCNHYFWSWVIVLCLPFHVRPVKTTVVNFLNVSILAYQVFGRLKLTAVASSRTDVRVIDVSPNLAYIEFPNSLIMDKAINPGAHVRVTNYSLNPIVRAYKQLIPNYHPYTLVSLPLDRSQKLIIRKSSFKWENGKRYMFHGSFDPKLLLVQSRNQPGTNFSISKMAVNAKKILIVVGGSAISFAIPILRVLNYHGIPVKILWVVRDFRDIIILRYFDGFVHGDDIEIFVTGSASNADGFEVSALRSATSYGTFRYSSIKSADLEQNDHSRFFYTDEEDWGASQEVENVDVDLSDEEDEDDDCQRDCTIRLSSPLHENPFDEIDSEGDEPQEYGVDDLTSTLSRKTSRSPLTNEQFAPQLENDNECHKRYLSTIKRLNLGRRIYKGRPKLNYRYYNWCVNQNDIFTQCSGPQMDDTSNLVCCRDLPGRHHLHSAERNLPDAEKVWVISAGPKSLVKNVKLWASENGLKYHEEAFYV